MIVVASDEDPFERPACGLNDVTAVLGGRRQSGGRLIAVIGVSLDIENYCTVSLFFEQAYL